MRRIGGGETRYGLRCVGRSCDGALFELFIAGARPVEFNLLGMPAAKLGVGAGGEPCRHMACDGPRRLDPHSLRLARRIAELALRAPPR